MPTIDRPTASRGSRWGGIVFAMGLLISAGPTHASTLVLQGHIATSTISLAPFGGFFLTNDDVTISLDYGPGAGDSNADPDFAFYDDALIVMSFVFSRGGVPFYSTALKTTNSGTLIVFVPIFERHTFQSGPDSGSDGMVGDPVNLLPVRRADVELVVPGLTSDAVMPPSEFVAGTDLSRSSASVFWGGCCSGTVGLSIAFDSITEVPEPVPSLGGWALMLLVAATLLLGSSAIPRHSRLASVRPGSH